MGLSCSDIRSIIHVRRGLQYNVTTTKHCENTIRFTESVKRLISCDVDLIMIQFEVQ